MQDVLFLVVDVMEELACARQYPLLAVAHHQALLHRGHHLPVLLLVQVVHHQVVHQEDHPLVEAQVERQVHLVPLVDHHHQVAHPQVQVVRHHQVHLVQVLHHRVEVHHQAVVLDYHVQSPVIIMMNLLLQLDLL